MTAARLRTSSGASVGWYLPVRHRLYEAMPASVWIRCLQLLPYLDSLGVRNVVQYDGDPPPCVAVFVRRQDASALAEARRLRAAGTRIVLDLCVNYPDEKGVLPGGYGAPRARVEECRRMLEVADAVTCASEFIRQRVASEHPLARYVPDSIDAAHFTRRKQWPDLPPRPRAIWSGVNVKSRELEPLAVVLDRGGYPLTLVSDEPPAFPIPYDFVRWTHAGFPEDIVRGDVGVSFRACDDTYTAGHSAFKLAVMMFEGLPVLASPLPSYLELLAAGGGMICRDAHDWEVALHRFGSEPDLLRLLGAQARQVAARYATARVAPLYLALFSDLGAALEAPAAWGGAQ